MTSAYITTKWVFDLKDEDTYFCTADIGWVTGHSYIVYGPLLNGATSLMYEGAPNYPDAGSVLVDHRKVPGQHLLYGADGDSRVHQVGRSNGRQSTISRACVCWELSASRSILKRGSGIASTSATIAVRSSIRGGRPKRAP